MAFTFVTVTARYETLAGTPASGQITITPNNAMSNGGETVSTVPVTVQLANGQCTFSVAAVDDPGTSPQGCAYTINEAITNATPRTYQVQFSASETTISLSDLAPAQAGVPMVSYQLISAKDTPGGYPGLDSNGLVHPAVIPWTTAPVDSRYDAAGAASAAQTAAQNDAASKYLPKTDPSVTNARTPTAHASSHATGGSDALSPFGIGAAYDFGWISAKAPAYGAKSDGTTDDSGAINAALAAAKPGQVVYAPGNHALGSPIIVPPQVTLKSAHGMHLDQNTNPSFKPLSTFSGAAVILLLDQTTGGYSQVSNDQRIENVTIDCSALTGNTIDGIQAQGLVHGVYLTEVGIYKAPNHGVATVSNASGTAYSWRGTRVRADNCLGIGFNASMTDCVWIDCEAIGSGSHGWYVNGAANAIFVACKAEWSANDGFNVVNASTGTGSGGPTFIGCTTDRNAHNGFSIPSTSTGNAPISLVGITCRRDGSGSASSGYAGVNVNGAKSPVLIDGLSTFPGVNDDSTGTASPQYGLSLTGVTSVSYSACYLHAISAGYFDGGSNGIVRRGLNVQERTGPTSAPVVVTRGVHTYGTYGDSIDVPAHAIGIPHPREHGGAIAWTDPSSQISGGTPPASGTIVASALFVPRTATATKLFWGTTTAGAGPVTGQNFVALFDSSGNQLVSVGVDARVTVANGSFQETINVALQPGVYWVAWLFNATTPPSIARGPAINASLLNFNTTPSTARFVTNATGQTAMPSSLVLANNVNSMYSFWAALA